MKLEEVIERYTRNAEYERTHGSLQGCLEFRQLAEWLKDYKRLLEKEPCEDEYIKVPKKALKYRTAGMVAYNAEWLKNHFDLERAVICGAQEPCEDATLKDIFCMGCEYKEQEPKTGHWIQTNEFFINQDGQFIYKFICSECKSLSYFRKSNKKAIGANVCPNCGAKMQTESDIKQGLNYADEDTLMPAT